MYSSASCSECKLENLISDPESGEMVCRLCGIVVEEKMQETKIQSFEKGVDSRGTEPSSLASPDMGLSTLIGITARDAKGQTIDPSIHSAMQRLKTWNYRIQLETSKDRNLKAAFEKLQNLKDKLNLSEMTTETAAYIYRKALMKGLPRGRSIDSVIAGAAYIAIGETPTPISLKEISQASNIRQKTIARMVRLIALELDIMIPIANPMWCVTKIGNIAGLSEKTKREAVKIMSQINDSQYSNGKNPMALAATTLYIACSKTSEYISQDEIAKAAGVTDVTIRTRLKDMKSKNLVQ
jgi:transcription initiation factor TFIIB